MKFSTATFAILSGASFASATSTLRRAARGNSPACITDIADINWTTSCSGASVLVDIAETIGDLENGCAHNRKVEAMSLTGNTNIGDAKQALVQLCQADREPCLDLKIFSDLPFVNCTNSEVMNTLEAALDEIGCQHNKNVEARLITEMDSNGAAKIVLKEICELNLDSCLGEMEDLVFQSSTCNPGQIMDEIEAMLLDADCGHNRKQEALLLTGMSAINDAKQALKLQCLRDLKPCTSLAGIEIINCDRKIVMKAIREEMDEACPHNANKELMMLTGAANVGEAKQYIDDMCSGVWDAVESTQFEDIDATNFQEADFITNYFQGNTFLNTETSNFQLDADGKNSEQYPISERTIEVGENIDAFREDEAKTTVMDSTVNDLNGCNNQAMMCCFGRDRQSDDNNGNCAADDCDNADPADNSDLCSTGPAGTGTAYPDDTEGDIHCHGVAWAESENDPTNRLRFNNLFFVSMYDHMYTRGYVENALAPVSSGIPMCSCIEEMPTVSRSDCTEVAVTLTVTLDFDANRKLTATPDNDLNVEFNACTGAGGTNNDLSAHVQRLSNQGKISDTTKAVIDSVVVGTCPA